MNKVPRLTCKLRLFTNLGRPKLPTNIPENDLSKKRLEYDNNSQWKSNWKKICQLLPDEIQVYLSNVHQLVLTCCNDMGSNSSALADEMSFEIIKLLVNERLIMTKKNIKLVKDILIDCDTVLITKIMEIVADIQAYIDDEHFELINSLDDIDNMVIDDNKNNGFGSKIPYNKMLIKWPDEIKILADMKNIDDDDRNEKKNDFSMIYHNKNDNYNDNDKKDIIKFDKNKNELEKSLNKFYDKNNNDMPYEEFNELIKNILEKSNNLQTELLDLFGFENIDMIEFIVTNKDDLLLYYNKKYIKQQHQKQFPLLKSHDKNRTPQYGCQVIVQSQKEKLLSKQVRKEEKKLIKNNNKLNKLIDSDNSDDEFDPIKLRVKRQEALLASNEKILAPVEKYFNTFINNNNNNDREKYPYVFDCKKNNNSCITALISGKNIILPENTIRKNSSLCEQVDIPVTSYGSVDINYKTILISQLDDIGKEAFKGVEKLNRIQSIVFNAAYNSNENLLICAPTGAGKTNVALLTVIHQLKLHYNNGIINKNEFKIIYIAPMKALAAEMTTNFNKKLSCLGINVKEYTGDMQLTKKEIQQTQMIVTTPEKWDVVTRKGTSDISLTSIVKLLIIDEVHLLHGDRGPVVEALVARTLRQVETSQSMIRIVGLSATLPNYIDVARFLRVNPHKGLFYFDHRFRPVPLSQTFIGVKTTKQSQQINDMDIVCYNQVIDMVKKGHQVMVFVHARNATVRTANKLKELALHNDAIKYFKPDNNDNNNKLIIKAFNNSKNKYLSDLYAHGFSTHHAGMLRTDRNMVEKYFSQGSIKVLVCTSTLAWGVNLPAHAVIIRGTEIYDAKHGSFIDIGILDVLQIFGRAGRPQFDTFGHAAIITTHNKLNHYLSLLTNQFPIESSFINHLADNLNAEIALGTISNINEAVEWLSYTYLYVRMKLNPIVYGLLYEDVINDHNLDIKRKQLIHSSAINLDKAKMIRYNVRTGDLNSTDLGRTASHFYLKYDTIEIFNELSRPIMDEHEILSMVCQAHEFQQLKVRDEEMDELDNLTKEYCKLNVIGGSENIHGKINILIQTYLSHGKISSFSLISDQSFIIQNALRIVRALFELKLRSNNALMATKLLNLSKMLELQQWDEQNYNTPLRQFTILGRDIIDKIEQRDFSMKYIKDMNIHELINILRKETAASLVKKCCNEFPLIEMDANIQPITRTVLRIRLKIKSLFKWNDSVHGKTSEAFWIWIEDTDTNFIYHYEYFMMTKKSVINNDTQELIITIPLSEELPSQYMIKATSDRWLECCYIYSLPLHNIILPNLNQPHTDLLELQPLPITVLNNKNYENLYKFTHFNPIQTQIFHCLYHTDNNVLLGAPTGSGKTIAAEIAMFRVFNNYKNNKIVYIAPLKALVRERIKDWKIKFQNNNNINKRIIELTGDVTPDIKEIAMSDIIVTTPEKWDGISRSWQTRNYVKNVCLIIIDEIHLLGEDRGPVLEVIVSRTNFISSETKKNLRIIGLSTALANSIDLGNWLGIKTMGLYNFRPSVRPVPIEVHINGFPGKHYCPRMATMNRPTFQAIRQHAPTSPSLVFVSSRRQTRLTALDLIAYLAAEDNPKQWLKMPDNEMNNILNYIHDINLKLTLEFGIGIHHAGLHDKDRDTVEELFVNNKIQVLVTTSTLAWGVNFPAHLVVIKGTEYYDGKTKRYVDMPITDVLQMMGRAGRPQFDDSGVAVVLVHDVKKNFYKKFLYEPFPVESSLLNVLPDHINAEIVAGTIKTKQEFLNYLTWTYFFRRLLKNPKYYGLDSLESHDVNKFLSYLVDATLATLINAQCIYIDNDGDDDIINNTQAIIQPLSLGKISSYYYLSYKTITLFSKQLVNNMNLIDCLKVLCMAEEYAELPVRHNEDIINEELSKKCRYPAKSGTFDSPNTKAYLLFQAHFSRLSLPSTDYITDTKSILDQAIRLIQAMIDVVTENGWLSSMLTMIQLLQMVIQARWIDHSALLTLPHITTEKLHYFDNLPKSLPEFCSIIKNLQQLKNYFNHTDFDNSQIDEIYNYCKNIPIININISIQDMTDEKISDIQNIDLKKNTNQILELFTDSCYTLHVNLKKINSTKGINKFKHGKSKDDGWFIVFGDFNNNEVWALKRIHSVGQQSKTHQLELTIPQYSANTTLVFYLISDSYIGMDQQYKINAMFKTKTQD